jgi:hypothetical protein
MSGEVISLDQVRARRLPVPVAHYETLKPARHPQEKIVAAGDVWLVDSVLDAAEQLMGRLLRTNEPLEQSERARVMRASAALRSQPEA